MKKILSRLAKNKYFLLGGIILLGALLRLLLAYYRSMWDDEAFVYFASGQSLYAIFFEVIDPTHPPFIFFLVHVLRSVFDRNLLLLRLPSLISGIFVVTMSYYVGKRYKSHRFGLILSFLCSISPFFITFSWQIRNYVFSHLILVFILLLLPTKEGKSRILLLCCAIMIAPWINYGLIWLLIAIIVWEYLKKLFINKSNKLDLAVVLISIQSLLLVAIYLFWTIKLSPTGIHNGINWIPSVTVESFGATFVNFFGYFDFIPVFSDLYLYEKIIFFFILLISLYGIGAELINKNDTNKEIGLFLIVLIFVPNIISITTSLLYQHIYLWRNLYVVAYALLIGLSLGIEKIISHSRWLGASLLLTLLCMCVTFEINSVSGPRSDAFWEKTNWKSIVSQIEQDKTHLNGTIWFVEDFFLRRPFNFYLGNSQRNVIDYSCMQNISAEKIGKVNWIVVPKPSENKQLCLTDLTQKLGCISVRKINQNLYQCY